MNNKAKNESKDWEYFTITPQLVWALSRDPYDYTLWDVIKTIAGDAGECYLSTEDLATLAMMSTGKASDSRQHLISTGLLQGEIRRDPGYPQPVWHLRIPDLWKRNIEWRLRLGNKIADRLEWKKQQKEHEKSLHLMKAKPSPGEEGTPPSEEGTPPDETKNIQKEQPKGYPSDYLEGIFSYFTTQGNEGIADPEDDAAAYLRYRDEALQVYQELVGSFGRTPQERQTRREAILKLVMEETNFDTDRWQNSVRSCILGGANPNNVTCMIDTYHAGGDYSLLFKDKRSGNTEGEHPNSYPHPSGKGRVLVVT